MKLLDTNELLRLYEELDDLRDYTDHGVVSVISYIEFLSFGELSEGNVAFIKNTIGSKFIIEEITGEIADQAASLRRKHSITLGDSIILATALVGDYELVTRDKRLKRKYDKLIAMKSL